ncbi:MAG: ROK family protein, partial [Anaerolineae bacterium]|nr:ROK family protein [Anaerolineae bacterium]
LIESNFVVETGQGPSAGGKRPTLLRVAHDAHQLICVDLGSQEFRGAVLNLRGDIIYRLDVPSQQHVGSDTLDLAFTLIDQLVAQSTENLLGIGIGTPGLVNAREGVVLNAVNLNWVAVPLRDLVYDRYEKPVYIANDSHMAALAEYTFGSPRDSNNLIVIKVGRGIGAGIVIHGQPFYGDGMGAGEIGHVVVVDNGRSCTCGNRGCLETVASTTAILAQANLTWAELIAAYENGETAVTDLITNVGNYLGQAIAALVGSTNIHHIVITGRLAQFGQPLLDTIQTEMRHRAMPIMADKTEVSFAKFGNEVVMLGCSAMILNEELGII